MYHTPAPRLLHSMTSIESSRHPYWCSSFCLSLSQCCRWKNSPPCVSCGDDACDDDDGACGDPPYASYVSLASGSTGDQRCLWTSFPNVLIGSPISSSLRKTLSYSKSS